MGRASQRKKKRRRQRERADKPKGPDAQRLKKLRAEERRAQEAAVLARASTEDAEREMAERADKKPSRLRLAFLNAWNLAGLAVCGVLTAVTKSPVPLVAGVALEAGWLAFATRPKASALLFAGQHEAHAEAVSEARRVALMATLSEGDAERVRRLEERRHDILRLCGDNHHVAKDVLLAEVARLEDVVDAFIDLAASSRRWEAYAAGVDVDDLESEARRYEDEAGRALDEEQRALARKNLDMLLTRRGQLDELRRKISRTRAQLDLIESTFRMIANEVMLMRDTRALHSQLDDLVVGVQAVREMSGAEPSEAAAGADEETRRRAAAAQAAAKAQQAARRS